MKKVWIIFVILVSCGFVHGTSVYVPYVQFFQSSGTFPNQDP